MVFDTVTGAASSAWTGATNFATGTANLMGRTANTMTRGLFGWTLGRDNKSTTAAKGTNAADTAAMAATKTTAPPAKKTVQATTTRGKGAVASITSEDRDEQSVIDTDTSTSAPQRGYLGTTVSTIGTCAAYPFKTAYSAVTAPFKWAAGLPVWLYQKTIYPGKGELDGASQSSPTVMNTKGKISDAEESEKQEEDTTVAKTETDIAVTNTVKSVLSRLSPSERRNFKQVAQTLIAANSLPDDLDDETARNTAFNRGAPCGTESQPSMLATQTPAVVAV